MVKKARNEHLIPVQVWRIYPYPDVKPPETFLVVLKGEEGKFVPISIGCPEGQYLVMAMQHVAFPRPLTHNLIKNLLDKIKGQVHQLVVHTLKEETFHAYLLVQTQDEVFYLDCRPSDGMILAMLMGIPIFMSPEVMEEAGRELSGMLKLAELGEEVTSSSNSGEEADDTSEPLIDVEVPLPSEVTDIEDVIEDKEEETVQQSTPPVVSDEEPSELDVLKAQLDRFVAEEAYEEAAKLRDQISQMESETD
ncbi:MAG: bifunctional nuclease family protein [Candidatus Latescibacterota bacterium]|nr:bifunctional nuclease family protein [Candidatus Latescibacterota bacterium]